MNEITHNMPATMSSCEIAELTGKRHAHVLRDIFLLEKRGDISVYDKAFETNRQNNVPYKKVFLAIEDALTLIFSYSKINKKKIISNIVKSVSDFSKIIQAINEIDIPEELGEMYVYIAQNTLTGNYKVGISKNPEERIKSLQVGCDGLLKIIAYKKAENGFQDEKGIHKINSIHRIHGEWFSSLVMG